MIRLQNVNPDCGRQSVYNIKYHNIIISEFLCFGVLVAKK